MGKNGVFSGYEAAELQRKAIVLHLNSRETFPLMMKICLW
jgi:hypothetical protein